MAYEDWDEDEELKEYLDDDDGFSDAGYNNSGCLGIVLLLILVVIDVISRLAA